MSERFDHLVQIMARLRGEGGCPWDRKQTRDSLKPYLVEEAYEVLDTIDAKDDAKLKEELGDVLLQVLFHAEIGRELHTFTIDDVLETLAEKLIRRHPHVFGEPTVVGTGGARVPVAPPNATGDGPPPVIKTAAEVVHRWEEIKRKEKTDRARNGEEESALEGVPRALPSLLRAYQLQVRAARVGFDWPAGENGYDQVVAKVHEELKEVDEARGDALRSESDAARQRLEDEVGDLLFSLVNLARRLTVNPEEALRGAVNRFADRFIYMERAARAEGRALGAMTATDMDRLWNAAKAAERERPATREGPPS
jgi:tetrapyrrole methylase family protein/MazG family protein